MGAAAYVLSSFRSYPPAPGGYGGDKQDARHIATACAQNYEGAIDLCTACFRRAGDHAMGHGPTMSRA